MSDERAAPGSSGLSSALTEGSLSGLHHLYSGKVRELFAVGDDSVLVVATDRVSVFDVVLPTEIPGKGAVLTAVTLFWLDLLRDVVPSHLLTARVEEYPPELQPYSEALRGRSMLCRRLQMLPVECVARAYLTGSGLADYRSTGAVCGVPLPPGLPEAARLEQPIFTPATKAPAGEHDENIGFDRVAETVGADTAEDLRRATLDVFHRASEHAASVGLLLADTKLEFGRDPASGELVLGDEVLTPDSSRYWPVSEWEPGRTPPPFDKQLVRDWVRASGWADGEPPPRLPADVVEATTGRYAEVCELLTGRSPALWAAAL